MFSYHHLLLLSYLANRGNVAIICYNALTVGTWDVTSTTLDGEVRLSTDDSLSAKYFQDFVASRKVDDNGKEGEIKYIKLLEDAVVKATALQDKDLGLRQIVIDADEDTTYGANKFDVITSDTDRTTVAAVIDASKAPRNNKEEATYKDNGAVVAYVPEEVYENVTSLNNKRIDVMFGKDNEVVMLIVVDDVIEDSYITAFDMDEEEIEIDGETYEFADDAVVTLFGYELTNENQPALDAIEDAIIVLGITDPDKVFNRTVKANIVVDEDGDIEKIDLTMSQAFPVAVQVELDEEDSLFVGMEEGIVKSISSKGVIKGYNSVKILNGDEIEDIEEEDEPRVIKDGAIASLEDIEVGDVVTAIYETTAATGAAKTYSLVYVSSNKVEGTISKVKNNAITLDGEVYNTVRGLLVDTNGEIDDAKAKNLLGKEDDITWKDLYDEDVEVYLNHVGEVSAIVATTEATDLTVGVLTRDSSEREDNDKDVTYLSVKLLTKDGSKTTYKVYNEDDDEDIELDEADYKEGDVVIFSADANGIIESDDFTKISDADAGKEIKDLDGKDLTILAVGTYSDYDEDKITNVAVVEDADNGIKAVEAEEYRFTSSTTAFNVSALEDSEDLGIIKKGWDALVTKEGKATFDADTTQYMLVDTATNRIVYYFAAVTAYKGTTDNYGALVDIELTTDDDDEKVYTATLYVDGEEVKYEIGSELSATLKTVSSIKKDNKTVASEGQFVTYTLSNDKITDILAVAAVTTISEDLSDEDSLDDLIVTGFEEDGTPIYLENAVKESLLVREIADDDIFFNDEATDVDGADVKEIAEITIDEDGCIIYDFRDGECAMFDGEVEDLDGLLVYGFAADCDEGYVDIIIILD